MATTQPTTDLTHLDPSLPLINISVFDLLLIELVPLAERMARTYESSLDRPSHPPTKHTPSTTTTTTTTQSITNNNIPTTITTDTQPAAADGGPQTDVFRDSVYNRLERLGFRVGQGLSERFSRDRPRFTDQLDVIKFLCKDLWGVVFKKQIDNLKTNHRVCCYTPAPPPPPPPSIPFHGTAYSGLKKIRKRDGMSALC
jgi:hypothetical protein